MDKILIEVYVPIMEDKYDVFIPINKNLQAIIQLLNKAINEMTNGLYNVKSTMLCDKITGAAYDMNKIVKDSGLKNGSKVLLV